eukprot:COSAG06_NODE_3520_length_5232_cov_6.600429_1_plen_98_part_00
MEHSARAAQRKKNAILAQFYTKNDQFTKTGSGQRDKRRENSKKERRFSYDSSQTALFTPRLCYRSSHALASTYLPTCLSVQSITLQSLLYMSSEAFD